MSYGVSKSKWFWDLLFPHLISRDYMPSPDDSFQTVNEDRPLKFIYICEDIFDSITGEGASLEYIELVMLDS